jgi:hypothetical protein
VAYADMGTYFMSICKEVMKVAEQWTGTRVEVSSVLLAMQYGLKGRVETAFGMTEPHDMPGVACGQGHECSPSRSKIMASFIQIMAQRVCRGGTDLGKLASVRCGSQTTRLTYAKT